MQIYTVIGLATVDEDFRNLLFSDPDRALRESFIRLSYIEYAALLKVVKGPQAQAAKNELERSGGTWCPIKPCRFARYSPEKAAAAAAANE